jgi:hypothetical protein
MIRQPENALNPYDIAGRLHNDIADKYYTNIVLPKSIPEIIDLVEIEANANQDFIAIKSLDYQRPTSQRLQLY